MNNMKILMGGLLATSLLGAGTVTYAVDAVQKGYNQKYSKDRFMEADTDGDGFLSKEEAAASITQFEGSAGNQRFEKADSNQDGLLSLEEAAARKGKEKEHGAEAARKAQDKHFNKDRFMEADADGDGFVTWEEAAATKGVADTFGGKRFTKADADGDGKLSFEEAKEAKMQERKAY